jgi:hypothetical protein
MKKIIYVIIFKILLLYPLVINAYGLEGHSTVLNIALNQLSNEKKQKITSILAIILDKLEDSEGVLNPILASSWVDYMRLMGVLNKIHFSGEIIHNPQNIPLPENANSVLFYKQDIYWNLGQAINAFKKYNQNPKTNPLSKFQQSFLLMYIVHLVADSHQPLHVMGTLYKPYINSKNIYGNTLGANLIKVDTIKVGKCLKTTKLHTIWDGMGCLTDQARTQYPPKEGSESQYFINAQKYFVKNLLKDFTDNVIKNATIDYKKYTMDFNAEVWKNDLKQFQSNVFSAINTDITNLKSSNDKIILSNNYLENVKQTTINLVFLAGLRLGYILNTIYPE